MGHEGSTRRRLVALLTILVASGAVAEQPSAEVIVSRYVEALGGTRALAGLESVRMVGEYVFNGEVMPMVVLRQRPSKHRLELGVDGEVLIQGHDGTEGWEFFSRDDEAPRGMDERSAAIFLEEWADFDGPLIGYASKGHSVELIGLEEIDGVETFHLRLDLASGRQQHWYIDSSDYRLVRKKTPHVHRRRGPYDRTWYYESYREAGGVLLPEYFEREDSQHVRAYEIHEIEVNPQIDGTLFTMPEPGEVAPPGGGQEQSRNGAAARRTTLGAD